MRGHLPSVKEMLSLEEFAAMNIVTPRDIQLMVKNNKLPEGFKRVEKNKEKEEPLKIFKSMLELVSNKAQNFGIGILDYVILPNFAHRCALVNLPSYHTTIGFTVKIKREFKQIKRYCVLANDLIECQSISTPQKIAKIAFFVIRNLRVLTAIKQVLKNNLNFSFFGLYSLQSNNAESLNCVNIKQLYQSSTTMIALSKINSSLQRFIIARNERYFQPHSLCKPFLTERIL